MKFFGFLALVLLGFMLGWEGRELGKLPALYRPDHPAPVVTTLVNGFNPQQCREFVVAVPYPSEITTRLNFESEPTIDEYHFYRTEHMKVACR